MNNILNPKRIKMMQDRISGTINKCNIKQRQPAYGILVRVHTDRECSRFRDQTQTMNNENHHTRTLPYYISATLM